MAEDLAQWDAGDEEPSYYRLDVWLARCREAPHRVLDLLEMWWRDAGGLLDDLTFPEVVTDPSCLEKVAIPDRLEPIARIVVAYCDLELSNIDASPLVRFGRQCRTFRRATVSQPTVGTVPTAGGLEEALLACGDIIARIDCALAGRDSATAPGDATTPKQRGKHREVAHALMLLEQDPGWRIGLLAKEVGVHRSTLYRSRAVRRLREKYRKGATRLLRGYVVRNADTGATDVEAVAPDETTRRDDRGERIEGSQYYREYCAQCGEPIRVALDEVGADPVCDSCK